MSEASIEYQRRQLARRDPRPAPNPPRVPSPEPEAVPSWMMEQGPNLMQRFEVPMQPGTADSDGLSAYERELLRRDQTDREAQGKSERDTAESFLRGILNQYGMGSLASQVERLVGDWGRNLEVIAEQLRKTPEYRTRFKGLVQLQEKGIADVNNEADYLNLESNYRAVFREAGLRDFLGQSGSQAEYDAIANIVGDYSLSVNEVRARVMDAQRVAAETPQEVRDALQRFYNVGAQDLVAYSLDPQRTMTRINELANAAILGGYAERAGLNIGVGAAERVAGLAGSQDINIERITGDLSQAREVRDATSRLAEIERGILTDEEVVEAGAGTSPGAGQRIRTLQSRERARFGGTAGVASRALASARTI